MVNRWISMVDKDSARIVNETTNRFGAVFANKKQQYDFLKDVLPKYKFHKINYIKRKSVDQYEKFGKFIIWDHSTSTKLHQPEA